MPDLQAQFDTGQESQTGETACAGPQVQRHKSVTVTIIVGEASDKETGDLV